MNLLGICAAAAFIGSWLAGVFVWFRYFRPHLKASPEGYTWDRNDPIAQRVFYAFVGIAAFGFLSGLVAGFQIGEWPPVDPTIVVLLALFPCFVLAWAAFGFWRLRGRS